MPPKRSYADTTSVPVSSSKAEIDKLLSAFGATDRLIGEVRGHIAVAFVARDRQVRFTAPLPTPDDDAVRFTATRKVRSAAEAKTALDQATRSRWRQLALAIKAKFVSLDAGVFSFEEEFGIHFVLADNSTVLEHAHQAIELSYTDGLVPPMLGIER